ncbi:hypothetical protein CPB86DRAFT_784030 [Serendipita vermifera]|nr:hypothetical protein CPB86DRAFT_784030 [Serendipita vermifera]
MIQRAGIALSRLAYDADFSITRLDYDPDPTFAAPTRHQLSDSHTVEDIIDIFNNVVGFDAKLKYNGFLVSIPIGSSPEQRKAFYEGNNFHSCDHFHAWANLYGFKAQKDETKANLLFIDLTPGQVTSKRANGSLSTRGWAYSLRGDGYTRLGDIDLSSAQDIHEKLITPVVPSGTKLDRVAILRPEGALPGVSNADLEILFADTPVDWVTIDDLSHGAAFVMTREPTSSPGWGFRHPMTTQFTIGITLANGELVTIVSNDEKLPATRRAILTTSQDNQTTVTVRLNRDLTPFGEVKLEGLIPRPKGEAAIKVTVQLGDWGDSIMTVEESGTNLKEVKNLNGILYSRLDADGTYLEGSQKRIGVAFGKNGAVGELPE